MIRIFKSTFAPMLGASCLALAAVGVVGPMTSDVAYAQDSDEGAAEGRQFSAAAGEKVNEALQMINADNPQGAINVLNALLSSGNPLNPYERSIIYQMLGQSYNEVDNTSQSLTAFQQAIDSGGLLPNEVNNMRIVIAKLKIVSGQFRSGATDLETYLTSAEKNQTQNIELLTNAWVQAEDYGKALPWAERWFNNANPKERKHFDLLNFLYNNLGMPEKQADIVKEMIQKWPGDRNLWNTWASMLSNGGREQDAFEVNKMLYLGGALTEEQDIKKVIQYYSYYEMPYQAAQILEREMNAGRIDRSAANLEELSKYYRTAREYNKAIPILEQAAQQSNTATLYAALGEAYYNEGQCNQAEQAFRSAIDRGYDAGKSWMQVANCIYDSTQTTERLDCSDYDFESYQESPAGRSAVIGQINQAPISQVRQNAIATFNRVPNGSRESRNARKWIGFIENERQAFIDRCLFEINVEKELCFSKIKLEYDNLAFSGGEFELDDESCLQFKDEYDELYVRVTTDG